MYVSFRTHSTILKGSGGSDPSSENDEHGGHAAIIELVKGMLLFHFSIFSVNHFISCQ